MKKLFYLSLVGIMLFASSCGKKDTVIPDEKPKDDNDLPVEDVDFNVTLSSTTFQAGEVVKFLLEGNPETIDFYSGEIYEEYEHKDGRLGIIFNPSLSFSLHTPTPDRRNQFFVMVSTDFSGDYTDYSKIEAATWTDVTDRMTFPPTANVYAASGPIDMDDLVVEGKPFYYAFKYVNIIEVGVNPPQWTILRPTLINKLPTGNPTIGDMTNSGYQAMHQNTTYKGIANIGADRIAIIGHRDAPDAEIWVVSKAFEGTEVELGPDQSIPIKSEGNSKLSSWTHIYNTPGTYKASFVVKVKAEDGSVQTGVKHVEVTVTL